MRKRIAAGNWKMNLTATQAQSLTSELVQIAKDEYTGQGLVILAPPAPYLPLVHHLIKDARNFFLSAQNMHQEESGAYTGETSASMLTSVGATYTILGHSERREYFGEDEALLAAKTNKALAHGLKPIFCVGESLSEREAEQTLEVVKKQLSGGLFHLSAEQFAEVVVAYEPVWAIGTGRTASPEQAQEVHQYLRTLITDHYGSAVAQETSILYGGSVKADNAREIFLQPDIDGGLVGGASLKSRDFAEIIKALG